MAGELQSRGEIHPQHTRGRGGRTVVVGLAVAATLAAATFAMLISGPIALIPLLLAGFAIGLPITWLWLRSRRGKLRHPGPRMTEA